MAEYRTIRMAFWNDPFVEELPAQSKLLYLYLFTAPHTNNLGLLEITRRKIAFETGIDIEEVNASLEIFVRAGKIITDGNFIWLVNFIKNQTSISPKMLDGLRNLLKEVENPKIRQVICERYGLLFGNVNRASADQSSSANAIQAHSEAIDTISKGIDTPSMGMDNPPITPAEFKREFKREIKREKKDLNTSPLTPLAEGDGGEGNSNISQSEISEQKNAPPGSRKEGTNPRALGTSPKTQGTNPRSLGTNPRAMGTNPRAQEDCEPEPDMEFAELRADWNAHMREEGPRAGFKAFLAVKKAREWPGLCAIRHDISQRKEAGVWNRGYEPGLEKYLADRTWQAAIVPRRSRASPGANGQPSATTEYQKLKQDRRIMSAILLEQEARELKNAGHVLETNFVAIADENRPGLPDSL